MELLAPIECFFTQRANKKNKILSETFVLSVDYLNLYNQILLTQMYNEYSSTLIKHSRKKNTFVFNTSLTIQLKINIHYKIIIIPNISILILQKCFNFITNV